jgi:hypothetical protein
MQGRRLRAGALAVLAALLPVAAAQGWSIPTHQATGAIAWADLARRDPAALAELEQIARALPYYPLFARAAAPLSPAQRQQALFEFLARWPDDIRKGPEDHPEWHYELRVVSGRTWLWPFRNGEARRAFALNFARLADPCAPAVDRARGLAWLIHIVGDVQQPLHAGHQMTAAFPATDRAGSIAFVRRQPGGAPTDLHEYWDQILDPARGGGLPQAVMQQWPRSRLPELRRPGPPAASFAGYLDESAALAGMVAYRGSFLAASPGAAQAPAVSQGENRVAEALARRRVAVAGYRIADMLIAALNAAHAGKTRCPA